MRQVAMTGLVVIALLSVALGFGIRSQDVSRMRTFGDAVGSWRHDPDFRVVEREYVTLGVEAMRSRWWGVPGERIVMGFRSLPGLPVYLRAAGSSAAHYRAFSESELSAYLHLTSEQGIEDGLRMIEELGRRQPLPDEDVVAFLNGFKLPGPIATDAGAIASVRRLLADTQQPASAFAVRSDVVSALARHVDSNVRSMDQLDEAVRLNNFELWRTKQAADFLGGVWAQGYGPIYLAGIEWLMSIRTAARITLIVALALLGALLARSHRPSLTAVGTRDLDSRTG